MVLLAAALLALPTTSPMRLTPAIAIYGTSLSLGMSASDIRKALNNRGLRGDVVHTACVADDLASKKKVVSVLKSAGGCVERIEWRQNSDRITIDFVEDFPARPGISVATEISWTLGGSDSKGAQALMQVAHNFGSPSVTDRLEPWTIAIWCLGFACTAKDMAFQDASSGPLLLVHRGAGLTFSNDRLASGRKDAIYRALTRKGYRFEE